MNTMISQDLIDILVCPKCKGSICLNKAAEGFVCEKCKLLYKIKEGIPIMLIEEAESINEISST